MSPSLMWWCFAIVIATAGIAVYVMDTRQSSRLLRILTRNTLLVTLLLLVYEVVMVALIKKKPPVLPSFSVISFGHVPVLLSVEAAGDSALVVGALVAIVVLTNMLKSQRFLRILARNMLLVCTIVLIYQVVAISMGRGVEASLSVVSLVHAAAPSPAPSSTPAPAVGDSVVGGPSLSASFVNQVLAAAGSPAVGTGQSLYDLSVQYHIDDAYALATFQHESTYGKYGSATANRSLGNIICAGYPTCNGRFRSYASWQEGYADFYQLIAREYVAQGLTTLETILPRYSPATENNTDEYIQSLRSAIRAFRSGYST